jgi:glutamate synthase (NADPH/NADH) small chain
MKAEGVKFVVNANVGVNYKVKKLKDEFDVILVTGGSTIPRDLPIPGRNLKGVHFAMDFLTQQNQRVADKKVTVADIWATDKNVIVIGGGDTGSDCVGTSNRHAATSITQIEIMPKPPKDRTEQMPWPNWPMILRTSSSHEEGCDRQWSIVTKEFVGDDKGNVKGLKIVEVEWKAVNGKMQFFEIPGSERTLPCDLALLAMGFIHPQHDGLLKQLSVDLDDRGNVKASSYQTSVESVFAAGDMRRGQSLVVWAISEGREAARAIDKYLSDGVTLLEAKEVGTLNLV